jgi:hypothetical protein
MLEIRAIMNSPVEEILGFKTCCGMRAFDQNLEVLVTNRGSRPVRLVSRMELRGATGPVRVDTLMPPGIREIGPGEVAAFYCSMDEGRWGQAQEMIFFDAEGNEHATHIFHAHREEG